MKVIAVLISQDWGNLQFCFVLYENKGRWYRGDGRGKRREVRRREGGRGQRKGRGRNGEEKEARSEGGRERRRKERD